MICNISNELEKNNAILELQISNFMIFHDIYRCFVCSLQTVDQPFDINFHNHITCADKNPIHELIFGQIFSKIEIKSTQDDKKSSCVIQLRNRVISPIVVQSQMRRFKLLLNILNQEFCLPLLANQETEDKDD